jgi:hypothetical protein
VSHSTRGSYSPYQRRSHSASHDRDQDLDCPVDQVDSPVASDVRPDPVLPPASPQNVNCGNKGSPYGDNASINEKVGNIYSDQWKDCSYSTVVVSNGGYAGANGLQSPRWKGGNDAMEEGEDGMVNILADAD